VPLVLDTGPIVALLDADDPDHDRCVRVVQDVAEDLVVPTPVLVEVDYWVRKLFGAETWATFADDLVRGA
jgi:predicted nucleic acid-binding protein